jgi:transcriptional regulator with XRE-family HTH domain
MHLPDAMLFSERLKTLIGDGTAAEFARKTGIGDSLIRKYLEGAEPGLEKILRICYAEKCSMRWLVAGEGDPFAGTAYDVPPVDDGGPKTNEHSEHIKIAHYNISSAARIGEQGWEHRHLQNNYFNREWWDSAITLSPDRCFSLDSKSELLANRFSPNQLPIFDRSFSRTHIDGVFILRIDGMLYLRKLEHVPGSGLVAPAERAGQAQWVLGGGAEFTEFKLVAKLVFKLTGERV